VLKPVIKIPERPYITLTEEDFHEILGVLSNYS